MNIFKIGLNYVTLFRIKFNRFSLRFLKRFLQTWYIGFLLIIVYIIISFVFIKLNVYQDYRTFLPATISTLLTIYILDFLRIEYDRKRDANKRMLFNLIMLYELCPVINNGIDEILSYEEFETYEDIRTIISSNPNFWDEDIQIYDPKLNENIHMTKKQYMTNLLIKIDDICKTYLSNYLSIANYEEYKLIHNIRIRCAVQANDTKFHDSVTYDSFTQDLIELFYTTIKIEAFYDFWYKDVPITNEIEKSKWRIKETTAKVFQRQKS